MSQLHCIFCIGLANCIPFHLQITNLWSYGYFPFSPQCLKLNICDLAKLHFYYPSSLLFAQKLFAFSTVPEGSPRSAWLFPWTRFHDHTDVFLPKTLLWEYMKESQFLSFGYNPWICSIPCPTHRKCYSIFQYLPKPSASLIFQWQAKSLTSLFPTEPVL